MSSFVFFCIQICLIQFAVSQRVNGPAIANNGLQYGPNVGLGGPMPQALGRMAPEIGGMLGGPGIGSMGVAQPYSAGMQNQAIRGLSNPVYGGAGMPNTPYGGYGMPSPSYGGIGSGDVAVAGELPVAGMTSVTGQVPLTGKVSFNGNVPCGGIVKISGTCTSCGGNGPYGQMPGVGTKPYGF